jgi:hypothetical protein
MIQFYVCGLYSVMIGIGSIFDIIPTPSMDILFDVQEDLDIFFEAQEQETSFWVYLNHK